MCEKAVDSCTFESECVPNYCKNVSLIAVEKLFLKSL